MNGYFLEMKCKRCTELNKLPPYSPFLNGVEQNISTLKAAIKADNSRPERGATTNEQMRKSQATRGRTGASSNSAPAISVTTKCWHNNPKLMWAVVPFYADIPAPLSKQRTN